MRAMTTQPTVEIPCTQDQAQNWESLLLSQQGKPYDSVAIRDFIDGSLKDRNWRSENAWFCDELGLWALERANICPPLCLPTYVSHRARLRSAPGGVTRRGVMRNANNWNHLNFDQREARYDREQDRANIGRRGQLRDASRKSTERRFGH